MHRSRRSTVHMIPVRPFGGPVMSSVGRLRRCHYYRAECFENIVMKYSIPEIEALSEESEHLYNVINEEPDLACVLIGTSYLDYALASLLKRYFIDSEVVPKLLEPPRGALSTFASRYDTA